MKKPAKKLPAKKRPAKKTARKKPAPVMINKPPLSSEFLETTSNSRLEMRVSTNFRTLCQHIIQNNGGELPWGERNYTGVIKKALIHFAIHKRLLDQEQAMLI